MVITKVSFKQSSLQLKKWDKATVTASRTFIRTASAPGIGRRAARNAVHRPSSDEDIVSKHECHEPGVELLQEDEPKRSVASWAASFEKLLGDPAGLHTFAVLACRWRCISPHLIRPYLGFTTPERCPKMGLFVELLRVAAIFLILWHVRGSDDSEAGKSDKEILDTLLVTTRYDKRLRPTVQDADFCCGMRSPSDPRIPGSSRNHSPGGPLTVNVSVLLLSLASPDESSLKYEVEFLLQQQWFDPRLRYSNKSEYEFLNAIHHHSDIWLPDTYFIMHGDFKDPLIPVHFALRIYRNGTVSYLMRRHLILSCQGHLHIFPFDDPQCSFAMESISYEQTAITYVWKNDEDTLRKSPSLTTLNAYLISNRTVTCPTKSSWRVDYDESDPDDETSEDCKCSLCQRRFEEQGNYSCLKVDLIFTRDRAFYFTTVFIPGIILVTSSFITFWLEWNAVPARVMIGVTTMLNFFTTSNSFRGTLPVVSNLTAMNVWDGVCMCFIYASLLEFVCVNYVGRKRPLHNVVYRPGENPVTQGDKNKRETSGPNEIASCTNCGPNPCTHTSNNGCATEVRKKEPPHPIRVAKTIDVIARITFPTAYAVFLIFFFIHYKGFS